MTAGLLNACAQVELLPLGGVRTAEVVARLQVVAARKVELPHVLAHGVPPLAAARAVANMVIDLAAGHNGARVAVLVAALVVAEVGRLEPGRILHGTLLRDELIDLHATQHLRAESHGRAALRIVAARINGSAPSRNLVIDEVRVVGHGVGGLGRNHLAGLRDAIAHQATRLLHGRRQLGGEDAVPFTASPSRPSSFIAIETQPRA